MFVTNKLSFQLQAYLENTAFRFRFYFAKLQIIYVPPDALSHIPNINSGLWHVVAEAIFS